MNFKEINRPTVYHNFFKWLPLIDKNIRGGQRMFGLERKCEQYYHGNVNCWLSQVLNTFTDELKLIESGSLHLKRARRFQVNDPFDLFFCKRQIWNKHHQLCRYFNQRFRRWCKSATSSCSKEHVSGTCIMISWFRSHSRTWWLHDKDWNGEETCIRIKCWHGY